MGLNTNCTKWNHVSTYTPLLHLSPLHYSQLKPLKQELHTLTIELFFLTCSWFAQFYLQNPAFLLLSCCIDIFRLWKLLKSICFRIDFEVIPGGDIIGFAFFAVLKLMDHFVDFKNIKKQHILNINFWISSYCTVLKLDCFYMNYISTLYIVPINPQNVLKISKLHRSHL